MMVKQLLVGDYYSGLIHEWLVNARAPQWFTFDNDGLSFWLIQMVVSQNRYPPNHPLY